MSTRSIKHYLLISWILPLIVAIAGSAVLSLGIGYLDFSNHRQGIESKLHEDAQMIARRVAAELLLKKNGRLEAVEDQLRSEFHLSFLDISAPKAALSNAVTVNEKLPDIIPESRLWLSVPGPAFSNFVNFRNLSLAVIPILGLVIFGFLIQRYLLRRYVIRPVQALSLTSVGDRPVKDHWPVEIQKIATELAESFSNREQAVFGQLARGLIHDIRTQINSVNTALQLVNETQTNSPERKSRLEKLESACARNVPKLRDLLNLSLDSSREITLNPKDDDLSITVDQAIQNVEDLAASKQVIIASNIEALTIPHDRTQLERVFTNLLKNAIEAIDDGNSSQRKIELAVTDSSFGLNVVVEDSGPGFSDSKQAFRPLKTTKTHGYGLGLFVSKKIVESHRGKLQVEKSDRLGGAKLTVSLPRKEAGL